MSANVRPRDPERDALVRKQLGERLEEFRLSLKLEDGTPRFPDAASFAEQLGVTARTYKRWAAGEGRIRVPHIMKLVPLGVEIHWLITGRRLDK